MRQKRSHLGLLFDVGELAALIRQSTDTDNFLARTARMVSEHLGAEVCSIYLVDQPGGELVLKATVGLNPEAVGRVRMRPGIGLVGTTIETLTPVIEGRAPQHPKFRYFKEADEDRFQSFLAVPIHRGVAKIGVLVVEHEQPDYFDDTDMRTLKAMAAQLIGALEGVQAASDPGLTGPATAPATAHLTLIKGKAASPGFAFGPAAIRRTGPGLGPLVENTTPYSLQDLHRAMDDTAAEISALQQRVASRLPESAALIFEAHLMMLKDTKFVGRIRDHVRAGMPAAAAVGAAARHYMDIFGASSHAYLREKADDIADLARRLLKHLVQTPAPDQTLAPGTIVVARNLYPSDILKFAADNINGIVLVGGGAASHVAILARSLGLPLVLADRPELLDLPEAIPLLLDADIGNIYVNPSPEIVRPFEQRNRDRDHISGVQSRMATQTWTADGQRIHLMANINLLGEVETARRLKAEGVGLYRSEFPFLVRAGFPSEEEQVLVYRQLCDAMAGRIVTFRTLDVGGEKVLAYSGAVAEDNPELGLRSIRFSLRHPDIFSQQVRAILRAGAATEPLRIMFPLIGSIDEFRQARQVVVDSIAALAAAGLDHNGQPGIGLMVELPAIVPIIGEMAAEADFLSIGTNDFIQYMLGVDRNNPAVRALYRPEHPAVLRALATVASAALAAGKDLAVCGEMAHEAAFIPFLLGIGVRRLSADPRFLPDIQATIGSLSIARAETYAAELLACASLEQTGRVIREYADGLEG